MWHWMETSIPTTMFKTCAKRICFTFVRYCIFVFVTEGWQKAVVCPLVQSQVGYANSTALACHLLTLTGCCWYKAHLDARLLSLKNGIISGWRSGNYTGCQLVNVSISSTHNWTSLFGYSGEPQHLNSTTVDYRPKRSLRSTAETFKQFSKL